MKKGRPIQPKEVRNSMGITIDQIQSLLSTYHRQQVQSKLAEARGRQGGSAEKEGDRVVISAEAKRLEIYQKTAEEVLRRLRQDSFPQPDSESESGACEE
ncbi:MAG: hypothetical protein WHX93_11405 [bacterium]